jgi:hypothetical protein
MSYVYQNNVDAQSRFEQFKLQLDSGTVITLQKGSTYDLTPSEVARASRYIVLVDSNAPPVTPPDPTPTPSGGGSSFLSGTGAPSSSLGVDGDAYFDKTNKVLYGPKASGAWGSGTSLVGPQGPQGATGSQGPQGAAGATGATGPAGASSNDRVLIWDTVTSNYIPSNWRSDTSQPREFVGPTDPSTINGITLVFGDRWTPTAAP